MKNIYIYTQTSTAFKLIFHMLENSDNSPTNQHSLSIGLQPIISRLMI